MNWRDTKWVIIKYLPYSKEKWCGIELTKTERRGQIHERFRTEYIGFDGQLCDSNNNGRSRFQGK